jgi:hypothetical protein
VRGSALRASITLIVAISLPGCTGADEVEPEARPPGAAQSPKTRALQLGATALQQTAPPRQLDVYVTGFHPLKDDPSHQLESHHFCHQVNEDFLQCVLYDGNTAAANLHGIEYIISERLFDRLPAEEQAYWHPHNGEILSGQLVAPGLPEVAELELMRSKINSYGKTWHTWDTHAQDDDGELFLPFGEPRLGWSFNRFGEAMPELVERRDRRMGIDTEERRRAREELVPLARPQSGVDALEGRFQRDTAPIPGVVERTGAPVNPSPAH